MAQPSQIERAQAAYGSAFDGEVFDFPIDALDHLGIPVATVCGWPGGMFCDGIGYGPTSAVSRLSAWGEFMEAVLPKRVLPGLNRVRGSHRELSARGVPVIDPLRLRLPVGAAYTPDTPLQWVEARRHPDLASFLVPVEFAAQAADDLGEGSWLITPITNGMGAGDSLTRAVTHGLLELLQRDGNSVSYRALDQGIALDLDLIRDPWPP